jgi:hypothetical protein
MNSNRRKVPSSRVMPTVYREDDGNCAAHLSVIPEVFPYPAHTAALERYSPYNSRSSSPVTASPGSDASGRQQEERNHSFVRRNEQGCEGNPGPGLQDMEERGTVYLSLVRRGEHPLAGCETPERPLPRVPRREPIICEYIVDAEKHRLVREDEMQGCLAFVPQTKRKYFPFPPHLFIRCQVNASRGAVLKVPVRFLDETDWGKASPCKPYERSIVWVIRNKLGLGEWEKIVLTCKGRDIGGDLEALSCNEIDAAVEKRQEGMCAAAKEHLEGQGKHPWLGRVRLLSSGADDVARVRFHGVECSEPLFAREDTQEIAWAVRDHHHGSTPHGHGVGLFAKAVRSTSQTDLAECAWLSADLHPHIIPAVCVAGTSLVFFAADVTAKLAPAWLPSIACAAADEVHNVHMTMALHVGLALEYMHRHGTLHLDVRPGNIMVTTQPHPTLTVSTAKKKKV